MIETKNKEVIKKVRFLCFGNIVISIIIMVTFIISNPAFQDKYFTLLITSMAIIFLLIAYFFIYKIVWDNTSDQQQQRDFFMSEDCMYRWKKDHLILKNTPLWIFICILILAPSLLVNIHYFIVGILSGLSVENIILFIQAPRLIQKS